MEQWPNSGFGIIYLWILGLRNPGSLTRMGFSSSCIRHRGKWRAAREVERERERPTKEGLMKTGCVRACWEFVSFSPPAFFSEEKGKIKTDMEQAWKAKS